MDTAIKGEAKKRKVKQRVKWAISVAKKRVKANIKKIYKNIGLVVKKMKRL